MLSPPLRLFDCMLKLFLSPMAQSDGFPPVVVQLDAGVAYHDARTMILSVELAAPIPWVVASIGESVAITVRSPLTEVPSRLTGYEAPPPVM